MLKMQMPETVIEGDRRRDVRVPLSRPCKIHDPQTGKYIGAVTQDISAGGVLVEVPRILSVRPGDTIHVGVAMKRRDALLRCTDMLKAAVTRALHTVDDRTLLGLRFEQPFIAADALQFDAAHGSLRAAA